jgi:hypothetical protein
MAPLPDNSAPSPEGENTFVTARQGEDTLEVPVPQNLFPPLAKNEPEDAYLGDENPEEGLKLAHVEEEAAEVGDADSAGSAQECEDLDGAMQASFWDRVQVLVKQEQESDCVEPEVNVEKAKNIFDFQKGDNSISYPKVPEDWVPSWKPELGQSPFSGLDNPGDWPEYCFAAKFAKADKKKNTPKTYAHNTLPTGARPIPNDEDRKRKSEGW